MAIVETIARRAANEPAAVAAIVDGRAIGFGEVARQIAGLARGLAGLGLAKGGLVAVDCAHPYSHLLLLLAAQSLGAVSASLVPGELGQLSSLPRDFDLVISDGTARPDGVRRFQTLTKEWAESVLSAAVELRAEAQFAPGDAMRMQRSSGTTGSPKHQVLTFEQFERRVASWALVDGHGPGSRTLLGLPFIIGTPYYQAMIALRAGGALVVETRMSPAEALVAHAVTHLAILPLNLRRLVETWPAGLAKPAALSLVTVGGKVAPAIRRRALERVCVRLREVYSSNEMGNVSIHESDEDGAPGALFPGVRVEILDDRGTPVAPGEIGHVRVKTPYMTDSYPYDPEATARMFKDGWFHPGDLARMPRAGLLEVIGRDDELLNLGGVKRRPETIEEQILAVARPQDAGVCTLANGEGVEELWIAVVVADSDRAGLRARLAEILDDRVYGATHVVALERIPRTESGKIRRAELKRLVSAAAAAQSRAAGKGGSGGR